MILDDAFVAAGDEDEMLDAGLARLFDDVLDQRLVHHRQHFLRDGLGRRQEPGAEAGHGKTALRTVHAVRSGEGNRETLRFVAQMSVQKPPFVLRRPTARPNQEPSRSKEPILLDVF